MDPEDLYFWNVAVDNLVKAEEAIVNINQGAPQLLYDKRLDAFNLTDKQFIKNYRVTKQLAREIIETVRPYLPQQNRISGIPVEVMIEHEKNYDSEVEKNRRFAIFQENVREINAHNQLYENGQKSYSMGINQFSDMTLEEFLDNTATERSSDNFNTSVRRDLFVKEMGASVPATVDWRNHNAVTPVKNQNGCGACWAFASIAALESAYAIKFNFLTNFSVQQLIDCGSKDDGLNGCQNGQLYNAFDYISRFGVELDARYPYEARQGSCRFITGGVVASSRIVNYVEVPGMDEVALAQAVAKQPVAVIISASGFMQHYRGGILDEPECRSTTINHDVLIVGYGNENGRDYWLAKNSWGSQWGEGGYIKLARGVNMCNMAVQPIYPVLA